MIVLNGHEITPTVFPDGTSQVWKFDGIKEPHSNTVVWYFESESEISHLSQLKTFLDCRAYSPEQTEQVLYIPYLPYARQDKTVRADQTFALHGFARLLNAMKWDRVIAFDAHSSVPKALINNFINLTPDFSWADYDAVIFPDKGAQQRYMNLFPAQSFSAQKVRDQETGRITHYTFEHHDLIQGKRVLVVDDLCDGGATFKILGKCLFGVKEVSLYVSHGIFSKGIDELLNYYDTIITTNTYKPSEHLFDHTEFGDRFQVLNWENSYDEAYQSALSY